MEKVCTSCGEIHEDTIGCSCETIVVSNEEIVNTENVQYIDSNSDSKIDRVLSDENKEKISMYCRKVGNAIKELFLVLLTLLRYPYSEGTRFVSANNKTAALGLICLQALFVSLLALVMFLKVENMFGGAFLVFRFALGFSIFKIFLMIFLFSIVLSCVLIIAIFILSRVLRNTISFTTAISIVAMNSVIICLLTTIAIVISIFSIVVGGLVFCTSTIFGICFMTAIFPEGINGKKDGIPYIVSLSSIIPIILVIFFNPF